MLVRTIAKVTDTDDDIKTENWRSKRIILAKEGVGFSVPETTLYEGTENYFWYANHIEAVFVTHGEGEIEDLATGEVHQLAPGSLYLLNDHDKHKVRVRVQPAGHRPGGPRRERRLPAGHRGGLSLAHGGAFGAVMSEGPTSSRPQSPAGHPRPAGLCAVHGAHRSRRSIRRSFSRRPRVWQLGQYCSDLSA